jgi:MFS family permease
MNAGPEQSLWQELKQMPVTFWVLFAGIFINRAGTFVYPFLTLTLGRRGLGMTDIGLVLGGYGFGAFLASLVGGWFADRFGRKDAIVWGTVVHALSVLVLGYSHSLWLLFLMTTLAGFSGSFFGPAVHALVADVVPEPLRLRAFATFRVGLNAGFAVGAAVGGWLAYKAPMLLFWGDAITTLLYSAIALLWLPSGKITAREKSSWGQAWAYLARNRAFWMLFGAEILISLMWGQFSTTYAKDLERQNLTWNLFGRELSPSQIYGLLVGWNGLMIMLVELPATRWTQRFGLRQALIIGLLLQGLGFSMNALPWGITWLYLGMTFFTLGEIFFSPMHSTLVAKLCPEDMRGRYQGALGMGACLARMASPSLGFLAFGVHPALLWTLCGVAGILAAVLILRGIPATLADDATAATR